MTKLASVTLVATFTYPPLFVSDSSPSPPSPYINTYSGGGTLTNVLPLPSAPALHSVARGWYSPASVALLGQFLMASMCICILLFIGLAAHYAL